MLLNFCRQISGRNRKRDADDRSDASHPEIVLIGRVLPDVALVNDRK